MKEVNKYFIAKQYYANNYPETFQKINKINQLTQSNQDCENAQINNEQSPSKLKKKKKETIKEQIRSEDTITEETSYTNECQEDDVKVFEKKLEQINFENGQKEKIKPNYSKNWIKKLKATIKKMRNQQTF